MTKLHTNNYICGMRQLLVVALCFFILFANSLQAMAVFITINVGSTPALITSTNLKSHCHNLPVISLAQRHIHSINDSKALDHSGCEQKVTTTPKNVELHDLNCEPNCCDRCSISNLTINVSDYYYSQPSSLSKSYPDDAMRSFPPFFPNTLYRPPKFS